MLANDVAFEFRIRYSKRPDDVMADMGSALACEDGQDYSAWPIVRYRGQDYDLIVGQPPDARNMNAEEAEAFLATIF
jgi:hypothetical protein